VLPEDAAGSDEECTISIKLDTNRQLLVNGGTPSLLQCAGS
jgi:hypothetical protein